MVSSSTAHRHLIGNRINAVGWSAMVACKYCTKKGWECKMSSLSVKCGNCYHNGISKCEPVELALPDFGKIDSEMSRLEEMEEKAEEAEEAAMAALQAARSKLGRLRKQKKLLKRREKALADRSSQYVEDLSHLEALENGLMPGSLALDWSAYSPAGLGSDDVAAGVQHGSGPSPGGTVATFV